ncbi:MAG: TIGR04255 family protein, partial [Proteobacteria bacterium]|nr:TIGR04255 family protein [Pseudomonadota bacterium]
MTEHYPKAPITEAIIALHFSSAPSIKSLEKFADKEKKNFPKRETLHSITAKIDVKTAKQDASVEVVGFKLTNPDAGLILQVSRSQFGVSKLAPYDRWEELFGSAHHAWEIFKSTVGHVGLSRLSTRFINRIDIPNKLGNSILLNDYFSLGLVLPKAVSEMGLVQFGISCRLDDPKNSLLNIININTVDPPLL